MIDRAGQLWEHMWLRYLVLCRVEMDNDDDGYSWLALCLHDQSDSWDNGKITCLLSEEFFTKQEWWERVA